MNSKMFTSVLATVAVSYLAYKKNVPGRVSRKNLLGRKKRTQPLFENPDESNEMFI